MGDNLAAIGRDRDEACVVDGARIEPRRRLPRQRIGPCPRGQEAARSEQDDQRRYDQKDMHMSVPDRRVSPALFRHVAMAKAGLSCVITIFSGRLAARLQSHGFETQIAYGDYTFEDAAAAARQLLNGKSRPDAIFCASDYMAFAALDVAC